MSYYLRLSQDWISLYNTAVNKIKDNKLLARFKNFSHPQEVHCCINDWNYLILIYFSSVETERNKFANNLFLSALFDLIDSEALNAYRTN